MLYMKHLLYMSCTSCSFSSRQQSSRSSACYYVFQYFALCWGRWCGSARGPSVYNTIEYSALIVTSIVLLSMSTYLLQSPIVVSPTIEGGLHDTSPSQKATIDRVMLIRLNETMGDDLKWLTCLDQHLLQRQLPPSPTGCRTFPLLPSTEHPCMQSSLASSLSLFMCHCS